MKRCCRTCRFCDTEKKECGEGGFTEIGDLDMEKSEEDCNAWQPREERKETGTMVETQTQEAIARQKLEAEFTQWIKPEILAEIIFEELESAEIPATVENAKKVYLDILEDRFYEAIKSCLEFSPEFAKYREGLEPVPTPS